MTESLENYLEVIGLLSGKGEVRVTDIASQLDVSKPSVLTALKSLEEQGLVEHRHYGTVSLTKTGMQEAGAIRERHMLLTSFLHGFLGVNTKTAEEDACKMEHLLSRETLNKIREKMQSLKPDAPDSGIC